MPTADGTLICPDMTGATNWFSPSYNPSTHLLYFMALENCQLFISETAKSSRKGHNSMRPALSMLPDESAKRF